MAKWVSSDDPLAGLKCKGWPDGSEEDCDTDGPNAGTNIQGAGHGCHPHPLTGKPQCHTAARSRQEPLTAHRSAACTFATPGLMRDRRRDPLSPLGRSGRDRFPRTVHACEYQAAVRAGCNRSLYTARVGACQPAAPRATLLTRETSPGAAWKSFTFRVCSGLFATPSRHHEMGFEIALPLLGHVRRPRSRGGLRPQQQSSPSYDEPSTSAEGKQ